MDSTLPPPPPDQSSSSAAASGSNVSSHSRPPRGGLTMSAAALTGAHHSQSKRRSSLYPPSLPSRNAAAAASCPGGSSSRSWSRYPGGSNRSQTAMLYEELCAVRRTSAHFLSRIDSIVDDQRNREPLVHQQPPAARPSSSRSQQHLARPSSSMSGPLDLTPNGIISAGSFSPGTTTTPSPSFSTLLAYAPSPSSSLFQPQHHAWPPSFSAQQHPQQAAPLSSPNTTIPGSLFSSSASTTSCLPDLPSGSIFANLNAPPQLQDQGHGSVFGFAAFAQASSQSQPPLLSHHLQRQQPWNSLLPVPSSSSSWSPSSSSDNNDIVPSSWTWSNTALSAVVSSPSEQELAPLPPPLHLPVKQEPVVDPSSSNTASLLDPELIYIDNNDDEPADLDTLMASLEACPALMASLLGPNPSLESVPLLGSASSSGDMHFQMGGGNGNQLMMMSSSWGSQTWSSPAPEDVVNGFGTMSIDGGSSSAVGFGSMAWTAQMSSMPSLQQQLPWQQGGTLASSSSGLSPHCWQSSQSEAPQQFMQTSSAAGVELPPLPPTSMDMGTLPVGNSTSSATHVLQQCDSTGPITRNANSDAISGSNNSKMLWQGHSSSSTGSSSSLAMPKLRLGGMESRRVPPPSSPSSATAASSTMSRSGANGNLFTDTEMERLMKDKRLKELVNTDPKRVKRILRNRASASKAKAKKKIGLQDLEHQFEALQAENLMLSSQLLSEQAKSFQLKNQNNGLRLRLQQLEVQAKIGQDESEALRAEIKSLKFAELSGLY